MNFSDALGLLRQGHVMRRNSWLDEKKNIRILTPKEFYKDSYNPDYGNKEFIFINSRIYSGIWTPSSDDILAMDWIVVGKK